MSLLLHCLNTAVTLHRQADYAAALPLYRHTLMLGPDVTEALHLAGTIECRTGDPAAGVTLLGRAWRLNPDLAGLVENIDTGLRLASRRSAGLAENGNPQALLALLLALLRSGLSQPLADTLIRHSAEHLLRLSYSLHTAGKGEEAVPLLAAVVDAMPDYAEAWNLWGVVLRRLGHTDAALEVLRRGADRHPDFTLLLLNLASMLRDLKDFPAMVGCYARVAEIALIRYNAFELSDAEGICRSLLSFFPLSRNGHIVLGLTLLRLDRPDEAAASLREAVCLEPDFAEGHRHHGDALLAAGRLDEAAAAYRRALALTPAYAEAIGGVGLVEARQGAEDRALSRLRLSQRLKSHISATASTETCLRLRRGADGVTFPRRSPRGGTQVLSISCLSSFGRLAHTLHDYLTVRLYAEKYGLEVETPEWVGGLLFDLDDPPMAAPRRNIMHDHAGFRASFLAGLTDPMRTDPPFADVDVFLGWTLIDLYGQPEYRERIQSWMKLRPVWESRLRPAVDRLDAEGETIVGVHIRRGDRRGEAIPGFDVYRDWLGRMWDTHRRPVLLLATDDPRVAEEFAPFAPRMLGDLTRPWQGLEHLQDFYLLMNTDVVAISAGGFARSAAALGGRTRRVFAPDDTATALVETPLWGG